LAVAILAVSRHRKNIVKLMNGTENKLGSKKGEPRGA
jgi:glycerol-3-phosphate acyltransferase PlsY